MNPDGLMETPLLNVINLTKYYGKKLAVEKVNLSVFRGEIVGFIGPNGAGKSTTMRTILGFLKPSSGDIYLFNQKATSKNLSLLIKDVGYVPGEVNYYGDVTVSKIFDLYASFYDNFDKKYLEDLIKEFDLQINKKFEELSLGNKKKVSIIQALAHKPNLLILDEPTNSLDPFMQKKLYKNLEELKRQGVGILLSSHVLSEVEKLCDRVVFIKNGKIIEPQFFDKFTKKITLSLKSENPDFLKEIRTNGGEIFDVISDNSTITIYFKTSVKNIFEFLKTLPEDKLDIIEDISIESISLEDIFETLYKTSLKSEEMSK